MKKIKILGEKLDIRFCMAVEIAYEEISGEPFDIDCLKMQKNSLCLGMAAIITANPDTEITISRLMNEASGREIGELNNAVIESMMEWLRTPKVVADQDAKETPADTDEAEKPRN